MESNKEKLESQHDQRLCRRYRKLAKFPFPLFSTASLRVIGEECHTPLRVKVCGKLVKEVAVEDPLPRGGHTQIAGVGAFSKNGGRLVGCVLFGHKASLAQRQQHQRWKVEMCIFLLVGVVMHRELDWRTPVCKLEFC